MPSTRTQRWFVATMLFLAAVLNYVDRSVLAILAPTIQRDLAIDEAGYSQIVNAFLVAYTASYLLSGWIVDRIGGMRSLGAFVGFWSLANAATGLAGSATSLGAARFLLGLGEAGGWTASPKITAQFFSERERAAVIGIYTAGGTVGATLAPLLAVWLAGRWGWQWAFFATGFAGIVWLVAWLACLPAGSSGDHAAGSPRDGHTSWRAVLSQRIVWVLLVARLLTDSVWYFLQFWFPKYLHDERGLPQAELAGVWVVYLAADIGLIGGGLLSGWLVSRGMKAPRARIALMLVAALLVPAAAAVPFMVGMSAVYATVMIAAFGHAVWLTNLSALAVDLIPPRMLATGFGVIAAGSGLGGIVMNTLVATTIDRYSYTPCFLVAAVLHPLAIAVVGAGLATSLCAERHVRGSSAP